MSLPRMLPITAPVLATPADEKRLRVAGFVPVVRWVDVANRSDVPLKTIEALTLLDRREAAAKGGTRREPLIVKVPTALNLVHDQVQREIAAKTQPQKKGKSK